MAGIITGRVFWTPIKDLSYTNKNGKVIKIKETTAKIVLLAIADSAGDYGDNSWQSFETIAKKASIDRRSVIRVVRALVKHNYLKIDGLTQYGTHNFSLNMDLLGNPPPKRAKVGRPKNSDSDAKIGDSESETSDPPSSNPLMNPPVIPPKTKRGASAKPKATDFPELVLFREVVEHWPKQFQRPAIIEAVQKINNRLGRAATRDDLLPFWQAWGKVSGNEWSLVWLTDWAVPGSIGRTNGKPQHATPAPVHETPEQLEARRALARQAFGVQQ